MAKARRDNGSGTIYQRENGTWQGKIYLGKKPDGTPKYKYLSGKSKTEVRRKIREFLFTDSEQEMEEITLGEYIRRWMKTYKQGTIKESSYDALESTFRNHIEPYIGDIQLQQLTPDDIQKLLMNMKNKKNLSHSTIKKTYDCLNAALKFATIKRDISYNPMLPVIMPEKTLFEKKEIRFFDAQECALIIEECRRTYSTGKPVYVYADVYILMLNTGIRMGEAIALEKRDWNREQKTLRIQRNIQSVQKRDENGDRITGKRLITNSTKTYSGKSNVVNAPVFELPMTGSTGSKWQTGLQLVGASALLAFFLYLAFKKRR